jgi:glutathione S-transferase
MLLHAAFVLALPVIVAWFGISVAGSVALVLFVLAWRWMITISAFMFPEKVPELQLDSISVSHFVEKVRWSMDRLELDYTEKQSGGTLGAWFLGRTVPRLRMRTGAVRSSIGNSAEILRYLWGCYSESNDKAEFLKPTADRVDLETRLDRYGRSLQVWIYFHLLDHRDLTIHAWGGNSPLVPAWQRFLLRALYPLLQLLIRKSFRISEGNYKRAVERIEALLSEIDTSLADGRSSILGDNQPNYADFTFAALSGPWLMPAGYGGGKADAVRLERDAVPTRMRDDIERWIEDYPRATGFVEALYANER